MKLINILIVSFVLIPNHIVAQIRKNLEYSISWNSTGFPVKTQFGVEYKLIKGGGLDQKLTYKLKLNKPNTLFLSSGLNFSRRSFFIESDTFLFQYALSNISIPFRIDKYTKDSKWDFFAGIDIGYILRGRIDDSKYQKQFIKYGFNNNRVNPVQLIAEFGIQYNINLISVFISKGFGINKTFTNEFLFRLRTTSLGIAFDLYLHPRKKPH